MAELTLRWEKSGLSHGLQEMLTAAQLVDVTIACQGEVLQAHKIVLAACSPHFRQIFMLNPSQHPVVIMQDTKLAHLKALLSFMYTGETNVTQKELPGFLKTAEALKIDGLAGSEEEEDDDMEGSEEIAEGTCDPLTTAPASPPMYSPPPASPPPPSPPLASPPKKAASLLHEVPQLLQVCGIKPEEEGLTWPAQLMEQLMDLPENSQQEAPQGSVAESVFQRFSSDMVLLKERMMQGDEELPVGARRGTQVHIGNGEFINKQDYSFAFLALSPQVFINKLCESLFGRELLAASSVCGKVCPRYKHERTAKPPLPSDKLLAVRECFTHWLQKNGYSDQDKNLHLGSLIRYIGGSIHNCVGPRPSSTVKSVPKKRVSKTRQEGSSGVSKKRQKRTRPSQTKKVACKSNDDSDSVEEGEWPSRDTERVAKGRDGSSGSENEKNDLNEEVQGDAE